VAYKPSVTAFLVFCCSRK